MTPLLIFLFPLLAACASSRPSFDIPALLKQHQVPGASIAVIEDGRVVSTQGFGSVAADTLFNAGSISKPVTAYALLRDGAIDLDAPIEDHLGGWRLPPSQFDNRAVTLRRILSHTAGLSIAGVWVFREGDPIPPLRETISQPTPYAEEIDALWDGTGGVRVIARPGTMWRYSGGGYALAQLAMENAAREDFASAMQRRVFAPLGMTSSTFAWPVPDPARLAQPYGKNGEKIPFVVFNASAAAGLVSSAPDLGRFVAALMRDSRVADAMLRRQPASAPNPWSNDGWGLGFPLERLPNGRQLAFHFGGNEGFVGAIALIRESRSGLVVLTNSSNGLPFSFAVLCRWLKTQTTGTPDLCSGVL